MPRHVFDMEYNILGNDTVSGQVTLVVGHPVFSEHDRLLASVSVRGTNTEVQSPIGLHDHLQVTHMYRDTSHCALTAIVLTVQSTLS